MLRIIEVCMSILVYKVDIVFTVGIVYIQSKCFVKQTHVISNKNINQTKKNY